MRSGSGPPNAGRLPRPPRRRGARKSATWSRNRAARNEPRTSPPPSTMRLVTPRDARASREAGTDTRPPSSWTATTSTPARSRSRRRDGLGAQHRARTGVRGAAERASRERGGSRSVESRTTRRKGRRVRGDGSSSGSSASAVPIPTRTASWRRLSQRAWRRWGALVIHFERPAAVAMRPSRVEAAFSSTNGRPRRAQERNRSFRRAASAARRPVSTATPARRRSARPRPATSGWGSRIAATTRAIPESRTSGAQGGVRPSWAHGSSVT